ncbi:MAG: hypothetical protein IT293_02100 [Deltaproteobacteria bacterium]|nr:hypothetical protein [Deltaproteobacteria bacterium]
MRLDDEQIERYSRQLILREVGPRGQERLLAARVAVVGADAAAARVVAYLAAAGVGWIAAEAALRTVVDPDQPDLTLAPLATAADAPCDAAVVAAATTDAVADALSPWRTRAATVFWIAAGRAGALPPCPRCAAAAIDAGDGAPALARLRDVVLATVVATEVVKAVLAIGTPLAGRVLAYDPATATLDTAAPTTACPH